MYHLLRYVLKVFGRNFNDNLYVLTVAVELKNVSRSHMLKIFSSYVGSTAVSFLQCVKCESYLHCCYHQNFALQCCYFGGNLHLPQNYQKNTYKESTLWCVGRSLHPCPHFHHTCSEYYIRKQACFNFGSGSCSGLCSTYNDCWRNINIKNPFEMDYIPIVSVLLRREILSLH